MAENLVGRGFVSENGPYLHSKTLNFRLEVGQDLVSRANNNSWLIDIKQSKADLQNLSKSLKTSADIFLTDWHRDYKKASQDLFLSQTKNSSTDRYKKVLKKLINSQMFIELVQKHRKTDLNEEDIKKTIGEDVLVRLKGMDLLKSKTVQELADNVAESIASSNKSGSKRIVIEENKIIKELCGELSQTYFQNKKSLSRRLEREFKKRVLRVDWKQVFDELENKYLSYFSKAEEINEAKAYYKGMREKLISKAKKLRGTDFSNISGAIGENIEVELFNDNSFGITAYDVGEQDETQLVGYAKTLCDELDIANNQISPMTHRQATAKQSGSDWLLTNKSGYMVRAQVKNSTAMVEELRASEKLKLGHPQTIKVMDEIKYDTFRKNIQEYSKGKNRLTNEDILLLDYLVANVVWARVRGGLMEDKSSDYRSGISGIMEMINRILTKEIGYFIGATIEAQEESISAVIGGSNIFYVIDDLVLFPTWLMVDAIIQQLDQVEKGLMTFSVTLGKSSSLPNAETLWAEKQNNWVHPWERKMGYGPGVLSVGREAGSNLLSGLKLNRANLNVNIDEILKLVYETSLEDALII